MPNQLNIRALLVFRNSDPGKWAGVFISNKIIRIEIGVFW